VITIPQAVPIPLLPCNQTQTGLWLQGCMCWCPIQMLGLGKPATKGRHPRWWSSYFLFFYTLFFISRCIWNMCIL